MCQQITTDGLKWGFLLWLIGYFLGIVFIMLVPPQYLGLLITPIGIAITLWVLYHKIHYKKLIYYLKLGVIWTVLAVFLDYLFIVKLFAPEDGYYKWDIFLYYFLTLTLPILVGWYKTSRPHSTNRV